MSRRPLESPLPLLPPTARRLLVRGRVQGVGFRPAVARLAAAVGVSGRVRNSRAGVEILVEGDERSVGRFVRELAGAAPVESEVQEVEVTATAATGLTGFTIVEATDGLADVMADGLGAGGALGAIVPPDRRACEACLDEVRTVGTRRTGYGFASCTDCGPRYSIVESMPYERRATSMNRFTACGACRAEYGAPSDRRFHAQTIACEACGPSLRATGETAASGGAALEAAVAALRLGRIVALRGLGGYQLLTSAGDEAAVARLRARKGRPDKPLAVLVGSVDEAERCGAPTEFERGELTSSAGPIVVVRRRADGPLAAGVSGELSTVGLMLPTTPLHALLVDRLGPLVATSGNGEGGVLAYEAGEAERELAGVADLWLHHDRPIERPIDDSVVAQAGGRRMTLRLARGLAPAVLPAPPGCEREPLLALGGHQKAACALLADGRATLGPYVGDLDSLDVRRRYVEQAAALVRLYGLDDPWLVGDLHPDYFTTQWNGPAGGSGRRLPGVQHHHAHVAAALGEFARFDDRVFAAAWDGTGWGPDGTVWGGEFLEGTAGELRRRGRIRPFLLPGGEAAIREPWRLATWMLIQCVEDGRRLAGRWFGEARVRAYDQFGARPWPGVWCSSAGRLFDAVAAIASSGEGRLEVAPTYDGRPAVWLEQAAEGGGEDDDPPPYPAPSADVGRLIEIDWRPLIAEAAEDRRRDASPARIARRFHAALVAAIVETARRFPRLPVVLAGGVFQNRRLAERAGCELSRRAAPVLRPELVPLNDGGLAYGQLIVAMLRRRSERACV